LKRLSEGAFWSVLGTSLSKLLVLLASFVLVRSLGKASFGEYGILCASMTMVSASIGSCLGIAATRYVSIVRCSEDGRLGGIVSAITMASVYIGSLGCIVAFILAPYIANNLLNAPHLLGGVRLMSILLVLNLLSVTQSGVLAGLEAFRVIAKVDVIFGVASLIVISIGSYLSGLNGAIWGLLLSSLLLCLLNYIEISKRIPHRGISCDAAIFKKEWIKLLRYCLPLFLSSLMVAPVLWFGKSKLSYLADGYSMIAELSAAEAWRMSICAVCGLVSRSSFPVLAHLYASGQLPKFRKILLLVSVVNTFIVIAAVSVLWILMDWIVGLYGREFTGAAALFKMVLLAAIPIQLSNIIGMVNRCTGKVWWGVAFNSLWAISYLGLLSIFINQGGLGVAKVCLYSYSIHLVFTLVYVVIFFRSKPFVYAREA